MNRGQVHALEAIVGGMLLLTSVIFALQMTAVTPLSASTSSQHIENQQQASAKGVLSTAAESGALRRSVLHWNSTGETFYNASDRGYYTQEMPTAFGRSLEQSFGARGIAYNVYLRYESSGTRTRERMVFMGVPSDNAVSATQTVLLTNETRLRGPDMERGHRINETNFYASDNHPEALYEIVRVEVVVWRI